MNGIPNKRAQRKSRPPEHRPTPADTGRERRRHPSPTFSMDSQTIRIADDIPSNGPRDLGGSAVPISHRTGDRAPIAAPATGLFMIHMPGGGEGEPRRQTTPPSSTSNHCIKDIHLARKPWSPRQDSSRKSSSKGRTPRESHSRGSVVSQGRISVTDPFESSTDSEPDSERESWMCREFEEDEVEDSDLDGYRDSVSSNYSMNDGDGNLVSTHVYIYIYSLYVCTT